MSRMFIEEAVIVETQETEPKATVEIVRPTVLDSGRRKKQKRNSMFSGGLFNLFGLDDLFSDIMDVFDGAFSDRDAYTDPPSSVQARKSRPDPPEEAQIVETNEQNITEIHYLYCEIVK